ncbi:autotransporter secretion inner membrane protein TamB [Nitrosospira multiformis]|uniref:Autotransporter secretion inner membrane protein TamB n=1 Tax=Nitrosospira multiformis TaxID=1231 RepID=A0A1H8H297_9PROT|nr:translocation/assembly module TamB domain-containing protein [Nitrosospira multiformis]SEN50094.1 autotransporter secretion inner membrane protein TamB [Nitrosospira multiformis]
MKPASEQRIQHAFPSFRWWQWMLLAAIFIILAVAGSALWLATSNSGLVWLGSALSRLSADSISFEGLEGKLSRSVSVRRMRFSGENLLIVAREVQLDWEPGALRSGQLKIIALTAGEVEVVSLPSPEPATQPDNLELPLSLDVRKFEIGVLRVMREKGGLPVFRALDLATKLTSDGHVHQIPELRVMLDYGRLTASAELKGEKPFPLEGHVTLAGIAVPKVQQPAGTSTEKSEARISATLGGDLAQIDVKIEGQGAGLSGEGDAQLRPFAPFVVGGLRLSLSGLDPHVFSATAPQAKLDLQADLNEKMAGQLEGTLTVKNSKPAALDAGGLPVLEARAEPVLSAELLQLHDLKLLLPGGGSIMGDVVWQLTEASGSADLRVLQVNMARLDTRIRPTNVSGSLRLSADVKRQQGILALHDRKLSASVHMTLADDVLTLEKVRLNHGQSLFTGQARMELNGQREFDLAGSLRRFDISAFLQGPRTDLNATLKLTGELGSTGTRESSRKVSEPAGTAQFAIANSHVAEQPVSGNGRIEFAGLSRAKGGIELNFGTNRLLAHGGYGRPGDQLQLELNAPALAQIGYGLAGSLMAKAIMGSSSASFIEKPLELADISFYATGKGIKLPNEHYLDNFTADGKLHGDAITLKILAADYRLQANPRLQQLSVEVGGSTSQHEIQVSVQLVDDQSLFLRGRGGLTKMGQWPDAEWAGELVELSGSGRVPFSLKNASPVRIGSSHASLGLSNIGIAGGAVQIREIDWSPERWSTKGHFSGIGLRPGAGGKKSEGAAEAVAAAKTVKTAGANENAGADERRRYEADRGAAYEALRLHGEWDISAGSQLKGFIDIEREGGDWILPDEPPLPLGLQILRLSGRATEGQLTAELTARGKRLGEANALVSMPLAKSVESGMHWTILQDAALSGHLFVNMQDISWAGPAIDDSIKTGGAVALQADVIGTFGKPRLEGKIQGDNLAVASLEHGVRLEQGKLAAHFDEKSLHMDILNFSSPHQSPPQDPLLRHLELAKGPGTLRASGVMDFTGERGSVEITANLVPLAQRPDRWIIASGSGNATLEHNMLTLKGNLMANAGLLAQPTAGRPHLPDDVIIIGRDAPDGPQSERRGLRIDVEATLDLGERFYIHASGLEGRLAGQLHLRGEPGQKLRTVGTITAQDTKFEAYGQDLTVERGIVSFQGSIDDPALNVRAVRKGLAVVAGVEVTGSVRHPVIRLVSTPAVSDLEKLSWITLGRAPGGKADASLLLAAAGSILGGQSGGVTDKITRALGVDELSIRQAGSDPLTGQIGTIGKRLSKEAYISYEQGLAAAAGVTKLTYALTPKITLVARAGMDNAIDVLYSLSFD